MALPQDTQFYQASGAESGFTASDRRKFSYGQTGSPHELTNPIVHVVGGMVLSGTDAFAFESGAVSPFTFDEYGRLKTDSQLVLSGGDVQIGAVEIKGGTDDIRVDVQQDNVVKVGSPAFLPVGGIYYSGTQAYTNTDAVVAQFNEQGAMKVTGGGGVPNAQYKSPYNFTSTYTSSTTITLSSLSGFSITDSSQIVYIKQITSAGVATYYTNGQDGVTMTVSSNVITISGAGTPFASGDVYEIGINALPFELDPRTQSIKNSTLNPVWSRYVTEHVLDLGSATVPSSVDIDMDGYQNISMQIEMGSPAGSLTILSSNDGTNFQNWTGSISSMGGLGNTAGSVFLTTSDYLVMNDIGVDTIRLTVSGAETTTDVYAKRWY